MKRKSGKEMLRLHHQGNRLKLPYAGHRQIPFARAAIIGTSISWAVLATILMISYISNKR
jgi:hypothetical protein